MAESEYVFPAPERFIVGTVGLPGDRSFYLQAKDADRVVTAAVEKEQVELLGERINELLDMVRSRSADGYMIPAGPDPADADNALSLIHISEPTRLHKVSRMPSSA